MKDKSQLIDDDVSINYWNIMIAFGEGDVKQWSFFGWDDNDDDNEN